MVPIPITLDPSTSDRSRGVYNFCKSGQIMTENVGTWWKLVVLYGMRGASYGIGLYGYSNRPVEYGDCRSEITPVGANPHGHGSCGGAANCY